MSKFIKSYKWQEIVVIPDRQRLEDLRHIEEEKGKNLQSCFTNYCLQVLNFSVLS